MPSVTRLGDFGSGHGCFPPRVSTSGSGDVFVNATAVHRVGDNWAIHACPDQGAHTSTLQTGSSTVFANNKGVGRMGDPIACGSVVAQGSPSVFAG